MREYLRKMRNDAGLTQLELAEKLDISESYYSLIENGLRKNDLTISMAYKLSVIFNVSFEDIFKNETELLREPVTVGEGEK